MMVNNMNNQLDIYFGSELITHLLLQEDQLHWLYTDAWKVKGFSISPHLPLLENIPSLNVQRFLRNLLPEGHPLDELTAYFNLSKNNTYALIRALGLDISGALVALPAGQSLPIKGKFRILPSKELAQRLDDREHYSLMVWDGKPRLSVAGVQDKINIVLDDKGNMGFGEGALCSTHILKFEKQKLSHLVLNEYFTMHLANKCGLDVAKTQLIYFDKHATLLVERFDREFISKSEIKRGHIIDGCQALNLPPEYKYEHNLGSNRDVKHIRDGVSLSKLFCFADKCNNPALTKKKILDWVLFNILIFNFDAHGKNISFFVSKKGISLAPFYDLVNIKMYPEFEHEMAMALGDEFDGDMVNAYQLADFADTCGLSRRFVSRQLKGLISKCQKALDFDVEQIAKNQDEKKYLKKYTRIVHVRCRHLLSELGNIASIEL